MEISGADSDEVNSALDRGIARQATDMEQKHPGRWHYSEYCESGWAWFCYVLYLIPMIEF
jgi:hypothetical protein